MRKAMELLKKAETLLGPKSHDYGEYTKNCSDIGTIASVIRDKEIDALDVAAMMIGVKLSRLANLTSGKGKTPKNESIMDTEVDGINYIGLFEEVREFMKGLEDGRTASTSTDQ